MTALVESLTVEALSAFEQVQEFGIGGMLRVSITSLASLGLSLVATSRDPRRHWKSSLHIKLCYNMCPLKPTRHSLRYMAPYPEHTLGRRKQAARRTFRGNLMVLRKHCMKVVGPLRLNFDVSRPRENRGSLHTEVHAMKGLPGHDYAQLHWLNKLIVSKTVCTY